jgi:hypothetical protein
MSRNERNQKIANVGIKAETPRQVNSDKYRASDQGKGQQYQHIEIEAEKNAGNADKKWQHSKHAPDLQMLTSQIYVAPHALSFYVGTH